MVHFSTSNAGTSIYLEWKKWHSGVGSVTELNGYGTERHGMCYCSRAVTRMSHAVTRMSRAVTIF